MRFGTPVITTLSLLAVSAAAVPAVNQGSSNLVVRDHPTRNQIENELKSIWEQLQHMFGRPAGPPPPPQHPGQGSQPPAGPGLPAPPPPAPPVVPPPRLSTLHSSTDSQQVFPGSTSTSAAAVAFSSTPSLSTEPSTSVSSLITTTNTTPTSATHSSETSSAASTTTVILTSEVTPSASSVPFPSTNITTNATMSDCSALCSSISFNNDWTVTPISCVAHSAGTAVNTAQGQSSAGCGTSFTPETDICQVTLNVKTSGSANTYMEVWLPTGSDTAWNGRTMSTDNGGLNGCVHYVDMQYVAGLGFAAIGDNGGHNSSSFDGSWSTNNNGT